MMKRFLSLLVAMLVLCACLPACAAPRYPERQGGTTDAAAVLSQSTLRDLATYAQRLKDETDIELFVVTVDFLDGETLSSYGEGLFTQWKLDDDSLLLLLAVGEDKFATFSGRDVTRHLSRQVQDKLLSTSLEGPFLRQAYDEAIASFIPALTQEINKAFDADVSVGGLFGQAGSESLSVEEWADEWARRWDAAHDEEPAPDSVGDRVTREDKSTGFSLGKVLLTVFLLMVIFGNFSDRRGRHGRRRGCGCAPFSSILAALGLWKLWDKD